MALGPSQTLDAQRLAGARLSVDDNHTAFTNSIPRLRPTWLRSPSRSWSKYVCFLDKTSSRWKQYEEYMRCDFNFEMMQRFFAV